MTSVSQAQHPSRSRTLVVSTSIQTSGTFLWLLSHNMGPKETPKDPNMAYQFDHELELRWVAIWVAECNSSATQLSCTELRNSAELHLCCTWVALSCAELHGNYHGFVSLSCTLACKPGLAWERKATWKKKWKRNAIQCTSCIQDYTNIDVLAWLNGSPPLHESLLTSNVCDLHSACAASRTFWK